MNKLSDLLAGYREITTEQVVPAVLRILADHHAVQAKRWRETARELSEEDRYLKGYIDCLNDVAIGNRRLALMSELGDGR